MNDGAAAVADALDLEVSALPICYACLSFVSFPLDDGDIARARREARRVAPDIWDEGLAEPAFAALRKASADGVPHAAAALRDAEATGGRSAVARAIVFRLATQMVERTGSPLGPEATDGWAGAGWTRV
jgi:hypothetical protein